MAVKRLSKLAREFNLGISTIVEFLNKKGFDVEANPNTKVSPECYDLLLKEYSSEISVKKESEKLSLRRNHDTQESVSIDSVQEEEPAKETTEQEDVILIKDVRGISENNKDEKETKKEEDTSKKEEGNKDPDRELKVVGKINLDEVSKKTKPQKEKKEQEKDKIEENIKETAEKEQKETTEPVVEEKEKEEKKTAEKEKPKEKKAEEKPKAEKKKEPKPDVKKEKTITEEKETKPEEPIKEEAPVAEEKTEKEPEKEKHTEEKTPPEQTEEEVIRTDIKEAEVKVVGMIDLKSLNQRTRPPKKSKAQLEEERKERARQEAETREKQKQQKLKQEEEARKKRVSELKEKLKTGDLAAEEENVIRAEVAKLTGPTVVGKIDLPAGQNKKKQPVASSSDKIKKKKRKRIQKDSSDGHGGHQHGDRGKKQSGKHQKKGGKKPQKNEVDLEDVQKQVKETLARLTSGKQKSKGAKFRRAKRDEDREKRIAEAEQQEKEKNILKVTEFVSANELASLMGVPVTQIISTCMSLGVIVSINQRLDAETMSLVAEEFGFEVEFVSVEVQEAIKEEEDLDEDLSPRPPIVTVMGHVDHGKTSLLDYVRNANVIAGEAGGITQHIGAYRVTLEDGKQITFLDTPGHEAFTAMRARGTQVTDLAIIVVAADDNVMPQTVEAINHAQAAGVPIVFAVNKIDKPGANPDKIKEELANMDFLVEDWGGKYQSQDISAKHGNNIDELLEKVLLESEMLELKANADKNASGSVIESSLDKGRGYVATILVQNGSLRVGDMILAGQYTGHVKAMYNERNQRIEVAGPSDPVLILGLNGAPQAGDTFNVLDSEREAKEIANKREQLQRELNLRTQKHITLDEIGRRIAIGNFQELNVIVKGDVDGSIEALSDSLIKLSTDFIQVNVIHKGVGQISETDTMLAAASNAIIVGFQVRPSLGARKHAEKEGIDIRLYSIIYDAINEIKDAMEGMLSPDIKEEITSTVEVREVYKISKVGTVAGCMVREGKINRNTKVRIIRDGIVIYTGDLGSLKRFKDDVKEVVSGYECGLNIEKFNDIKVGDMIEGFKETEVKKKL